MTKTADQIAEEIQILSADQLIDTNEGTHPHDKNYTWRVYERLDGTQYTIGDAESGAGYSRKMKHESAISRRTQIAALQQLLTTPQARRMCGEPTT